MKPLKEFFSALHPSKSVSYLVIQHLDNNGNLLAIEALKRMTSLEVVPLQAGLTLRGGVAYSVPPQSLVAFDEGKIVLTPAKTIAKRLTVIDYLFRSIGQEFGEAAIGVVLSGEASDGTQGLRVLNDAGGLAIVQNPDSAEHRSMPESAIATGAADHILSPKDIAKEINSYTDYLLTTHSNKERIGLREEIASAITTICEIMLQKTKHDFKHYKTSTLIRRIQRRMQVLQFSTVQEYIDHLMSVSDECEILFNELLINVTSFFRDKEAFEALKEDVLTKLVQQKKPNQKIRIWVAGCSSGEEAYSIAILLREIFEETNTTHEVQVIATDIDDSALNAARRGVYPSTIAEHVSQERLAKYFVKRANKYYVSKNLREMCLFSIHNLITDPPFSQLDLITCRNVIIYLGLHLQKKLFPVFHYALRTNGYLFLGTSESLTSHKELFKSINNKHRIAQRKATAIKMPSIGTSVQNYLSHFQESEKITDADLSLICQRIALDEMPLRYAAVNDEGQILSASAGINKYIQIPEGSFQNNIVKLVAPSLRTPLRTAFNTAKKEKRKITNDTCSLRIEDRIERICVIVQPMPQLGDISELYWIAFQSMGVMLQKETNAPNRSVASEVDPDLIEQLESELDTVRRELDKSVQDLEASNEELKSSNEELLSMNEELQSANEELETSKEEVQNSNEALQRANSDLENLLASTQIATLFLDDAYQIRGFTPAIQEIYNIRSVDIGRKLSDFTSRTQQIPEYPNPSSLTLTSTNECEFVLPDGRVFLRRILPYKTAEETRDGLVVTFIDVTELRRSEGRFFNLANSVPVITWTTNAQGEAEFFNSRWYEYTGQTREIALRMGWQSAIHPQDIDELMQLWNFALKNGTQYRSTFRLRKHDGSFRWFTATGVANKAETGKIVSWFGTCVDIHDQKEQVDILAESGQNFKTIIETIPQYIWRTNADGSADYFSERFCQFVGYPLSQMIGWGWSQIIHTKDRQRVIDLWNERQKQRKPLSVDFRIGVGNKGDFHWVRWEGNPYFNSDGQLIKYYCTWTDIHERILAEQAYQDSVLLFQTMANSAPVLVWIADINKSRTWFNKAWIAFTGMKMESSLGSLWTNFVHPEDLDLYLNTYNQHYAEQTPFQLEYRLKSADGSYRWINARGVPLFSENGDFEGFIGACLDIDEQKRLSDALKSSEAHFRTLVDHSPAVMWITNKKSECTYLSQQWYEITGRTQEQDLGFGWVENCHPEDKKEVEQAFFTAVEARGKISIRYRLRYKDGSYRWAIDSGLPLISDSGEFLGYIGTVVDIHDQIESEQKLTNLSDRFNRSIAATDLGVWYCDLPFDELIWNKEVKRHFFMPQDKKITINDFYAHIHPDDLERTRLAIQDSIDNRAPYDILYRTIDPNDSSKLHWIKAIGWTDYNKEGKPIRFDGITLDVTEDHFRQQELRRAKEEADHAKHVAETANESKTRFLANMSHEIRTPLSAIVGFSDLLRSRISNDMEANVYIERISRNSSQLSRLIDELLDLSKIEADKLEIDAAAIDIDAVIEDVKSAMMLKAEEKGIELQFLWKSPKPQRVITDPMRLSQILINMVGNAVKFTEKGVVSVELSVMDDKLIVKVSDTGIGLTPQQQTRIFEPFMQADSSITRKYGGTGLGLALSKKLAVLLGGNIHLERSALGEGTVFVIEIAIGHKMPIDSIAIETSSGDDFGPETLRGRSILVVDDSPDNRAIVGLFLKGIGASIVEAANGLEGYELALRQHFDLVLMDIQMPVMDGYQAMQKLSASGYQKPVAALTAHAFKEEKERCIAAGFTGYITKPINRTTLLKGVCNMVTVYSTL